MTLREYKLLIKALKLREVDKDYRVHQQAYLNFVVKAEKKAGKNKTSPVYKTFKKFFNYEKAIKEALGTKQKSKSKFLDLSRFLKEKSKHG